MKQCKRLQLLVGDSSGLTFSHPNERTNYVHTGTNYSFSVIYIYLFALFFFPGKKLIPNQDIFYQCKLEIEDNEMKTIFLLFFPGSNFKLM